MNAQFRTILVVDDNQNDVDLILRVLDNRHHRQEVHVARDGAEAVDYLFRRGDHEKRSNGAPHLVLLDLKMPRIDGLEVLRQIKTDAGLRRIPVVMLTSSAETKDVLRAYQLGANAYVVKPVDFQAFVSAVTHIDVFWTAVNEYPPESSKLAAQGPPPPAAQPPHFATD